jgi:hypothetical protein
MPKASEVFRCFSCNEAVTRDSVPVQVNVTNTQLMLSHKRGPGNLIWMLILWRLL